MYMTQAFEFPTKLINPHAVLIAERRKNLVCPTSDLLLYEAMIFLTMYEQKFVIKKKIAIRVIQFYGHDDIMEWLDGETDDRQ